MRSETEKRDELQSEPIEVMVVAFSCSSVLEKFLYFEEKGKEKKKERKKNQMYI